MQVPPGYALFIPSAIRARRCDLPVVGVGPVQGPAAGRPGPGRRASATWSAWCAARSPTPTSRPRPGRATPPTSAPACRATRSASAGWASTGGWAASRTRGPAGSPSRVPPPRRRRRRVVVVGGGPGGLQAAVTAAERGHQVDAVRAPRPRSAARPHVAAPVPSRAEFLDIARNLIVAARRAGGGRPHRRRGHRGHWCGPSHPTRSSLATGARPARPWWAGDADRVVDVRDVLEGRVRSRGPGGRRRRARLPPGHLHRRAAGRPGLRRWRSSPTGWWWARISASPSTWRPGTCKAHAMGIARPSTWCRWAWPTTTGRTALGGGRRSRCSTIRPAPPSGDGATGWCARSTRRPRTSCGRRCRTRRSRCTASATASRRGGPTPP